MKRLPHIIGMVRMIPRRVALLALGAALALSLLGAVGALGAATALAAPAAPTACDLQCVIAFGNQRIDDRTSALTKLNDHISAQQSDGHITSDQANALQTDISTNMSAMSSLKSKLDAETSATAARQDVHDMYVTYRIYAVVLPRDYGELALDIMANLQAKGTGAEAKIQDAINGAPANEQDHLNSLFSDYKAQLGTASNEIGAGQALAPQLTPDSYNNSRLAYNGNLQAYKGHRHTARAALNKAVQDLNQMVTILKQSATPTTSTTNS